MAAILAAILAALNSIGYGAAIWGFRASRRSVGEATWWFLMGFGLIAGAIILRGAYWDLFLPGFRLMYPELASNWSEMTSGRLVNNFFSGLELLGIYLVLKCRQALIPEEERHQWPWWKAWLHPSSCRIFWWMR